MYLLITMINLDIRSCMFTDLDMAIEAYRNSVDSLFYLAASVNTIIFSASADLYSDEVLSPLASKVIVD